MKTVLPFLVLLLAFSGCQILARAIYGIKKPKVENAASIRKKANGFGLDTTNILSVNSADFLNTMAGASIPDAAIFDASGRYIEYRETDTSCNAGLFGFIPELSLTKSYNLTGKTTLGAELGKCRSIDGHPLAVMDANADFYVLIYWATWTGKLNEDHVKVWEDLAAANKNCRVRVLKVNLDMQEYWEEEEREKIRDVLSKR